MAKESVSIVNLKDVVSSKSATKVEEKKFNSLNGFDSSLRKGARLLFLSSSMKTEKQTRGTRTFDFQFFWALDLERNKLVKVSRSGLSGGMGYREAPQPGVWNLNQDGSWYVLSPVEGDPAIQSRVSWGIGKVFPGAFDYAKEIVSIPKCFYLEVTGIEYLYSRNPVDASLQQSATQKDLSDLTFKEDLARSWDGKAEYPSLEFINDAVAKYNLCHEDKFTEDMILNLLH